MDWNQVCIETAEQATDLVSSVLLDAGAGGVEIEGGSVPVAKRDEYLDPLPVSDNIFVKAYYGEHEFDEVLRYIKECIESLKDNSDIDLGSLQISVNTIEDTDWNANFKKHFTAFRAAGNIVIKPTWENYEHKDGDIVIEMDPGMAFGSGVHETTKMCLELIQKHMPKNAKVLDVGCGSGILGIACAKLGAKEVLSLDYDSVSVKVTKENALGNDIDILEARQSDLLHNADKKKYNVVLANIIADIVIKLNVNVGECLASDSVYILSGIIEDRLEDVYESLKLNEFSVIETLSMGDWRALAVRRGNA